ncbi:ABC transporter ATP-binding protein [Mesorhizobium sp.]|uniref:ABC transporter ATP-binding protein n=1 Tax=Mesorhizobium sp. TaxID=1871066 RepID=UPI000FE96847|nr:sn-glycerol-3-phosphate ABC transporter ATP-binding protein UgpC [Mesorhizobium sp.]RWF28784.1 MAG: sn-glycerol-3-phosphate ABC transporter ATP-binding protein UgpC [Mesorhizobium sp.]
MPVSNVSINRVSKSYGHLPVIHDIDLEIEDGEFVVLVGPSGCGKSTLLRMIAGLELISGGEIVIGARVVNELPPKERDIAMVFQSYALYPHKTVAQNMSFALKLQRVPKAEIECRVGQAAGILGLDGLLDRYPRQLSGGQRQRVAMGRAIVRQPQVFLFDEPLSNLDAKLRISMRTEIKELHQRLKTTMIYVTHDQIEAMTMADKIVVMNSGRIEQVGAPLDLYDSPQNLFVAQFIGSPAMNLLTGTLTKQSQTAIVTEGGLRVPSIASPHLSDKKDLIFGIRPEHVRIDDTGFPATVVVVEPMGAETQVTFSAQGTEFVAVFRERIRAEPGEKIPVRFDPEWIYIFDQRTGQRL